MASMFDYLEWYGHLGFDVIPFNEVDNLILCQMSYLDLGGIIGANVANAVSDAAGPVVRQPGEGLQDAVQTLTGDIATSLARQQREASQAGAGTRH